MSEAILVSMIKAGSNAAKFMLTLSQKVREMNKTACQRAYLQRLQSAGLDVSSAARLTVLSHALRTEAMKPLASKAAPHISQSTISAINSLEQLSAGNARIKISNDEVSSALSDMTKGIQIAHEGYMIQEQRKAVDSLSITLQNRGYAVKNHAVPSREIWVKAHKGEHIVAAKIHLSSGMALDLAGFNPGECTEEREAIMAEMEKLGYEFSVKKQLVHNRKDGGDIVQELNKEFSRLDDRLHRLNLARAMNSRRVRK